MESTKKQKLGREEWLAAGLQLLWLRGAESIRAMRVAKALGVTTGSFYWHFKDLEDFKHALLKEWETEHIDKVITHFSRMESTPRKKLEAISMQVIEQRLGLYDGAIIAWASSDTEARKIAERVQSRRQEYIAQLFREVGFEKDDAYIRARILIAYHVGENVSKLRNKKDRHQSAKTAMEIICP